MTVFVSKLCKILNWLIVSKTSGRSTLNLLITYMLLSQKKVLLKNKLVLPNLISFSDKLNELAYSESVGVASGSFM
jgi:hypothetical protein